MCYDIYTATTEKYSFRNHIRPTQPHYYQAARYNANIEAREQNGKILSILQIMQFGYQDIAPTPQLNVSELYTQRHSRDAARLKAYNKILDIIHHRIRTVSTIPTSPCSLLYTIPPFILGLPRIDLEDCVVYIVFQLRAAGFDTRYTYPNLLNINWEHHEKSYILEQSPIMQAMIESDERKKVEQQKKAMYSKKLMGRIGGGDPRPITSSTSGTKGTGRKKVDFRTPAAPSVGHMPSASDYVPPQSFVRQMTEPPKNTVVNVPHTANIQQTSAFADLWSK